MATTIPAGYRAKLGLYETQSAISLIKRTFQDALAAVLNLERVSAPLFVDPADGLNDDLNGVERPVRFDIPAAGVDAEVVHSLAKWKRYALHRYGFAPGRGLYTDMNAIRRDESLDNLHSVYVDQWDWEKVITRQERNEATLRRTVSAIVEAIGYTLTVVQARYPELTLTLNRDVAFITSQQLLERYPGVPARERGRLSDGLPHDGRAPDYDDWSLNGDILFHYPVLDCALEISSMGIRVDEAALDAQLRLSGCEARARLPFHRALLSGELPLTIGGGIGQATGSRLVPCAFSPPSEGEGRTGAKAGTPLNRSRCARPSAALSLPARHGWRGR